MRTILCWLALAALPAFGQPRIVNGSVETRAAGAGLEGDVRAIAAGRSSPFWVGYGVPMTAGRHETCSRSVSLEDGNTSTRDSGRDARDGERTLLVFLRVEQGGITKIRSFSDDCEIDAGGSSVYLLTGVRPADSLNLLSAWATGAGRDHGDSAVLAIALHAGPAADAALDKFLDPAQPEKLRERTSFWLGAVRGSRGAERLRRLVRDDPSDRIREKAVFALYVSKQPDAVEGIIDAAKNDKSPNVRGQALFWLAQKASGKAASAIADALKDDPNTEVKKKAVFALSQLPKDEGIPRLIEVARTNRNSEVRKQAMFWLGQSKDPRALDFFEQVLKGQ
jgi:hypothetical protein